MALSLRISIELGLFEWHHRATASIICKTQTAICMSPDKFG
jgi:hypothetical protein